MARKTTRTQIVDKDNASAVSNVNWSTPKLAEALASLEARSEREAFRQLVEGLTFHAIKRRWAPLRQWAVLVDLIRDGWRPKADAVARIGSDA